MQTRITWTLLSLGLVAGIVGWSNLVRSTDAKDDPPAKKTPTKVFMREKLKDAQDVLEGLATEDFKLIIQGAKHMQAMSKAAEWHVIQGPVYAQHSAEFRRCCEDLVKRAEAKNVDASALSYLQLTMSCIACHKFVRSTEVVQNRGVSLPDDAQLVRLQQRIVQRP